VKEAVLLLLDLESEQFNDPIRPDRWADDFGLGFMVIDYYWNPIESHKIPYIKSKTSLAAQFTQI
jgi:hypothetical protein